MSRLPAARFFFFVGFGASSAIASGAGATASLPPSLRRDDLERIGLGTAADAAEALLSVARAVASVVASGCVASAAKVLELFFFLLDDGAGELSTAVAAPDGISSLSAAGVELEACRLDLLFLTFADVGVRSPASALIMAEGVDGCSDAADAGTRPLPPALPRSPPSSAVPRWREILRDFFAEESSLASPPPALSPSTASTAAIRRG